MLTVIGCGDAGSEKSASPQVPAVPQAAADPVPPPVEQDGSPAAQQPSPSGGRESSNDPAQSNPSGGGQESKSSPASKARQVELREQADDRASKPVSGAEVPSDPEDPSGQAAQTAAQAPPESESRSDAAAEQAAR